MHLSKSLLTDIYPDLLVEQKYSRLLSLIDSLDSSKFCIARCPARISLSKHSDYVNNQLLYIADDRDTYCIAHASSELKIINTRDEFENYSGDIPEQIDSKSWLFYPLTLIKILREEYELESSNFKLLIDSEIPAASGISSSHALILSCLIAIANICENSKILALIEKKGFKLLELCQRIEELRGFKSGLGDQAAQLYAKKDKILSIRLFPNLEHQYIDIDPSIAIISASSMLKSDKSQNPEAAKNLELYKLLNEKASEIFQKPGLKYLGDLDIDGKTALESIKNYENKELAKLCLYALAEGARTKAFSQKSAQAQYLTTHLNLSHAAERIVNPDPKRELVDSQKSLAEHIGVYAASSKANDELVDIAMSQDGVLASSITGAGFGGNNLILCHKDKVNNIIDALTKEYYQPRNYEAAMHLVQSSAAAGLIYKAG